jgi:uncharacterized protein with PIN domain
VNILDEHMPESQRQLARGWRIRLRQIGYDVARPGMKDDEIIPWLHHLPQPTFFTRDQGFYERRLCHPSYCLVYLDVGQYEVASFIRRFLRSATFRRRASRMGTVVRVGQTVVRLWRLHEATEQVIGWPLL